jgi:hypothetical protein
VSSILAPCRWHAPTRTFTGMVVWAPRRVANEAVWVYRMQFSADLEAVESGEVRGYAEAVQDSSGDWEPVADSTSGDRVTHFRFRPPPMTDGDRIFGRALTYFRVRPAPRTIFGHAFIQESVVGTGETGVASYHFPAESGFACTPPTNSGRRSRDEPSAAALAALIRRLSKYEDGIVRQIRELVLVEPPYISCVVCTSALEPSSWHQLTRRARLCFACLCILVAPAHPSCAPLFCVHLPCSTAVGSSLISRLPRRCFT